MTRWPLQAEETGFLGTRTRRFSDYSTPERSSREFTGHLTDTGSYIDNATGPFTSKPPLRHEPMLTKNSAIPAALLGLSIGASIAYLFDSRSGARRRAVVKDALWSAAHRSGITWDNIIADAKNRFRGFAIEVKHRLDNQPVDDTKLVDRVRTQLGRVTSHPRAIHVSSRDGVVILTGDALAPEEHRILQAVRRVWGVRNVVSHLSTHKPGNAIPALQGPGRIVGSRGLFARTLWPPSTRAIAALAGASMIARGTRQRSVPGYTLALGGLGFLTRAVTNNELRKVLGISPTAKVIDVHKSITIHAPAELLYDFWRKVENLPVFMSNLKEVRDLGDGRSHWTARGPAGIGTRWNAHITKEDRPFLISWSSEPGAPFANTGTVRFIPNADGGTTVDVAMWYNPPLGMVGHALARLLGEDPKRMMDRNLLRLKSLFESGKTTTDEASIRSRAATNQGFTAG